VSNESDVHYSNTDYLDGEHEISTVIYSDKLNPTPNPKPAHHVIKSVQSDTQVIFPSKLSVANQELTLSIPNNHTTEISHTDHPLYGIIYPCRLINQVGIPKRNVWILHKCGSVEIYGRMLLKMD
jgi:hypothetical protein